MLSQRAMQLSINSDDQEAASDSTLQNETPPSSPRGSQSDSSVASRDISSKFNAAARALPPGVLVKDDNLSLYDAVGSLEIMDPKMDSGLLLGQDGPDDNFDVLQELGPQQVLGIMDELLSFEMSWHQGFPLYRTLLSSHYIERLIYPPPASLEEAKFARNEDKIDHGNFWVHIVLRAYCIALVKTCDLVIRHLGSEKYHEEEDFNTNTHERDLLSSIDPEPVQELLVTAFHMIDGSNDTDRNNSTISAILRRLDLRQYLLYAVGDYGDHRYGRRTTWQDCEETIATIEWTHSTAEPTPGSYSQKLQFKIASSIPPKPLALLSWEQTVATLRNLCRSAAEAYSILDFDGFENLLIYIRSLTAQDPQPPVYVRCLMQSFLWHNNKILDAFTYKEGLFATIEETVMPKSNLVDLRNDAIEAPFDPRFKIASTMDMFARGATDAFLDMFVYQCMNRGRLDRDLGKAISTWDAVEKQAEQVDITLHPYSDFQSDTPRSDGTYGRFHPLKAWATRWKVRQMIWKVEMGFELDLYQRAELSSMYWLLAHFANFYMNVLLDTQAYNLQRLRTVLPHQKQKAAQITKVIEHLENDIEHVKATYHFAAALSDVYALLSLLGLIPSPFNTTTFSKPENLCSQRVKAFLSIAEPACPTLDEMSTLISLETGNDKFNTHDISQGISSSSFHARVLATLSIAEGQVKEAKKTWTLWLKKTPEQARYRLSEERRNADVKNVIKTTVQTGIVCATLRKGLGSNDEVGKTTLGMSDVETMNMFKVTIPDAANRNHKIWTVPQVAVNGTK